MQFNYLSTKIFETQTHSLCTHSILLSSEIGINNILFLNKKSKYGGFTFPKLKLCQFVTLLALVLFLSSLLCNKKLTLIQFLPLQE
jgi:hypothetical protein